METGRAVKEAVNFLEKNGSKSPLADVRALLCHCLGKDWLWCHLNRDKLLEPVVYKRFISMVERRAKGEPVAYIRGVKEFWSRDFSVNRYTLIPRPETEFLIEYALKFLNSIQHTPLILDVGTGCGNMAVTLAAELPDATVIATDIDINALLTARKNAQAHNVSERVQFLVADWFSCFKTTRGVLPGHGFSGFDVVASNPPYVSWSEAPLLEKNVVDFEPATALFSDEEGVSDIKKIISTSPALLSDRGVLLCEIGWKQGEQVMDLVQKSKEFQHAEIIKDYSGYDRLLYSEKRVA